MYRFAEYIDYSRRRVTEGRTIRPPRTALPLFLCLTVLSKEDEEEKKCEKRFAN